MTPKLRHRAWQDEQHCFPRSGRSSSINRKTSNVLCKTRSLLFLRCSCSAPSLFSNTCVPGTQRIGGDSKPGLSPATYDRDFCVCSSSCGNYSRTWKLGRQSVRVLSMWLAAYVCTSFFRKLYFTLHQPEE